MKKVYIIALNNLLAKELTAIQELKNLKFYTFKNFKAGADLYLIDSTLDTNITANNYLILHFPLRLNDLITDIKSFFNQPIIKIGKFLLDYHKRFITFHNNKIPLTEIECNILKLLYESKVQTKEEIEEKILGYKKEVQSNSLENHIYRLRQKIKEFSELDLIVTTKEGYRIFE